MQGSSESAYNALEALSKEAVAALAKERYLRQAAFARMTDLQSRLDQVRIMLLLRVPVCVCVCV